MTPRFGKPAVLFVGAANVDILARTKASAIAGASNPALIKQVPGGAALNAASICARFGVNACLSTVLGDDAAGDTIQKTLKNRRVQLFSKKTDRTGTYMALVEPDGGLVVAASDMAGCETGRPQVPPGPWAWLYIDANLDAKHITETAAQSDVPVALVSVSVAKVDRLRDGLPHAALLFTNKAEWQALCGADPAEFRKISAASVVITDGAKPITLIEGNTSTAIAVPPASPIVDVIGAGDAVAGGTLAALAVGMALHDAVEQGIAAAQAVLLSEGPYPERSLSFD